MGNLENLRRAAGILNNVIEDIDVEMAKIEKRPKKRLKELRGERRNALTALTAILAIIAPDD